MNPTLLASVSKKWRKRSFFFPCYNITNERLDELRDSPAKIFGFLLPSADRKKEKTRTHTHTPTRVVVIGIAGAT